MVPPGIVPNIPIVIGNRRIAKSNPKIDKLIAVMMVIVAIVVVYIARSWGGYV